MDVVIAVHAGAAVLLLLAGVAKLARPDSTAELIAVLGLPAPILGVRALGLAEVALGTIALTVGGTAPAVATGVVYSGFALVVVRAITSGAASCGCFGRADTPPSLIHVIGNTAFAIASFVAASADRSPVEAMEEQPGAGVPYVVLIGVVAGLAFAAFTALPEALAARRPGSSGPAPFHIEREGSR